MDDLNESKWKLRLSHKILSLVGITIVLSGFGAVLSGFISNRQLEKTVTSTVTSGYENVFKRIESVFADFQDIAEKSVKETSGLIALETIKKIAMQGAVPASDLYSESHSGGYRPGSRVAYGIARRHEQSV